MYNLTQHIQAQADIKQPTNQQIKQIRETQQYLQKHKIHELFNEVMAKLIETRPQPNLTKQSIATILKQIKDNKDNKATFFRKQDFQSMFDNYNFFEATGDGKVPYAYLIQALKQIKVEFTKEEFLEKYPQYKLDKMIDKVDFVNVLEAQYKIITKFH